VLQTKRLDRSGANSASKALYAFNDFSPAEFLVEFIVLTTVIGGVAELCPVRIV
jgi:hypothetical protein